MPQVGRYVRGRGVLVAGETLHQTDRLDQVVPERQRPVVLVGLPGDPLVLGVIDGPGFPPAPVLLLEHDEAGLLEAGKPVAAELLVTILQEAEGILVEAEPEMQAVLLDAVVLAAATRALAAEPPAHLVERDALE